MSAEMGTALNPQLRPVQLIAWHSPEMGTAVRGSELPPKALVPKAPTNRDVPCTGGAVRAVPSRATGPRRGCHGVDGARTTRGEGPGWPPRQSGECSPSRVPLGGCSSLSHCSFPQGRPGDAGQKGQKVSGAGDGVPMGLAVAEVAVTPPAVGLGEHCAPCPVPALSSLSGRGTQAALGTQAPQAWPVSRGCRVSPASGVQQAPKARR